MRTLLSPLNIRPQPGPALPATTIGPQYRQVRRSTYEQAARDLNQKGIDDQLAEFDDAKEKQTKAPWHREGADTPPVERQRSAGAMTKGMEQTVIQMEPADPVKANY